MRVSSVKNLKKINQEFFKLIKVIQHDLKKESKSPKNQIHFSQINQDNGMINAETFFKINELKGKS